MADYGTLTELKRYAYQVQSADDTVLAEILTRASRLFDRYVGVKASYFGAYNGSDSAAARKFWGDGTDYLQIDPYYTSYAITVAMPTGYTAPDFIESRSMRQSDDGQGFFLIRTYGDNEARFGFVKDGGINEDGPLFASGITSVGWPIGVKVTVTAKWGFDAVLEDIKEAVYETAIAIWRQKDQAFARVVNLETNQTINDVMPARARLIADRYRLQRGMFA